MNHFPCCSVFKLMYELIFSDFILEKNDGIVFKEKNNFLNIDSI